MRIASRVQFLSASAVFMLSVTILTAEAMGQAPTPEAIVTALQQKSEAHARLLLPPGGKSALRARIDADPRLKGLERQLYMNADSLLARDPLERRMVGRRLLATSRDALNRISTLGMAWMLSGDDRYGVGAESVLDSISAFSDWNPSHFLDVAEMTAAAGLGYDWLYARLSPERRDALRKVIIEKGINPSLAKEGKNSWLTASNNWNQVCNGGMTVGALAIASEEPVLAGQIVSRAIHSVPLAMKEYGPDGAYPEGPGYWQYGTFYNVLLIAALESALGTDYGLSASPGFLVSGQYLIHMIAPDGSFYTYADCKGGSGLTAPLFWIASRTDAPELLYPATPALAKLSADSKASVGEFRDSVPFLLLWAPSPLESKPPQTLDWSGQGTTPVATFRSSWTRDAAFLGIKGGSPSSNHAHMDAGSFLFESDGVRWVIDPGMEDYERVESHGVHLWDKTQAGERWNVFRISHRAHALVTFDGPQKVSGHATLACEGLGSDSPSAHLDLTTLYDGAAQHVKRTAQFARRKALVITDELAAITQSGTIRWQAPTMAEVMVSGSTATLKQAGKTLEVRCIEPAAATWQVEDTSTYLHDYDSPNPGLNLLFLRVPVEAGESRRVVVQMGSVD